MGGDMAEYYDDRVGHDAEIDAFYRERQFYQRQKDKAFKAAVQAEVAKQLKRSGVEKKHYQPRGKTVQCKCLDCGNEFTARVADRKRGWAKCCSKSCAASLKDKQTGGRYRDAYGS